MSISGMFHDLWLSIFLGARRTPSLLYWTMTGTTPVFIGFVVEGLAIFFKTFSGNASDILYFTWHIGYIAYVEATFVFPK